MKNLMVLYVAVIFFLISHIDNLVAQVTWMKNSGNPVLSPGGPGEWDDSAIQVDAVIFDDSTYHMWYTGIGSSTSFPSIGYATSSDGISWTKHINNPVFTAGQPGQWDDSGVASVSIIYHNGMFHMWYGGGGNFEQIGYATSPDGINNWIRVSNNPVLNPGPSGSWDAQAVQQPVVLFDNDTLRMWYHGTRDGNIANIGYATSVDGIVWNKYANNPVLQVGSQGEWDSEWTISPFVIKEDTIFQMWYQGKDGQISQIGYATSPDGIYWTKDILNNPVLSPGGPGEWDAAGIGSPTLVFNDSTYHMWYFSVNNNIYGIGYATSTLTTSISGKADILNGFSLSQNYPNPFNPTTTIEFSLPHSDFVNLKIFNILGEEVTTLVSNRLSAGSYSYEWDASNIASGVYLYRLQAGDYVETRKMVLMQ